MTLPRLSLIFLALLPALTVVVHAQPSRLVFNLEFDRDKEEVESREPGFIRDITTKTYRYKLTINNPTDAEIGVFDARLVVCGKNYEKEEGRELSLERDEQQQGIVVGPYQTLAVSFEPVVFTETEGKIYTSRRIDGENKSKLIGTFKDGKEHAGHRLVVTAEGQQVFLHEDGGEKTRQWIDQHIIKFPKGKKKSSKIPPIEPSTNRSTGGNGSAGAGAESTGTTR